MLLKRYMFLLENNLYRTKKYTVFRFYERLKKSFDALLNNATEVTHDMCEMNCMLISMGNTDEFNVCLQKLQYDCYRDEDCILF